MTTKTQDDLARDFADGVGFEIAVAACAGDMERAHEILARQAGKLIDAGVALGLEQAADRLDAQAEWWMAEAAGAFAEAHKLYEYRAGGFRQEARDLRKIAREMSHA